MSLHTAAATNQLTEGNVHTKVLRAVVLVSEGFLKQERESYFYAHELDTPAPSSVQ